MQREKINRLQREAFAFEQWAHRRGDEQTHWGNHKEVRLWEAREKARDHWNKNKHDQQYRQSRREAGARWRKANPGATQKWAKLDKPPAAVGTTEP
jgi:hypothetical protein